MLYPSCRSAVWQNYAMEPPVGSGDRIAAYAAATRWSIESQPESVETPGSRAQY